jgi:hypothetical protein
MMQNRVKDWFGERFYELHPLLQQLHQNGGCLAGEVIVKQPAGLAGVIGRTIANKMGIPISREPQIFSVAIKHQEDGLHWNRCFNQKDTMRSLFCPVGTIDDGYWLESTGAVSFHLGVDIKDGGWYWCCKKIMFKGLPLPLWLFPRVNAYKVIENGRYRFHVAIVVPILGEVLSYSGLLNL